MWPACFPAIRLARLVGNYNQYNGEGYNWKMKKEKEILAETRKRTSKMRFYLSFYMQDIYLKFESLLFCISDIIQVVFIKNIFDIIMIFSSIWSKNTHIDKY